MTQKRNSKRGTRKSSAPIKRTYGPGKKLFGKLAGTFVFNPKPAEDKTKQLRLGL